LRLNHLFSGLFVLLHPVDMLFCNSAHLIRCLEGLARSKTQVVEHMPAVGLSLALIQVMFSLVQKHLLYLVVSLLPFWK
jgi:hypothetical protein